MLAFVLLPIEKRDFLGLALQWGILGRAVTRSYQKIGLIPAHRPVDAGVKAALRAAFDGWRGRWGGTLAAGWAQGRGEGPLGRIGGFVEAVRDGRHTIVRDTTAVAIGWAAWLAVWLALASVGIDGFVSVAHAAANNADLARQIVRDMLPIGGVGGTLLSQGLAKIAGMLCIVCFTLAGIAALWTSGVLAVEYTTQPDSARQRYTPWMFSIRAAVALGCLAPVIGGGWSLGQKIVAEAGMWGSDKASDAWSAMTGYLGDNKNWVGMPGIPENEVLAAVVQTAAAEACSAAVNQDTARAGNERVVFIETAAGGRWDYQIKGMLGGWRTDVAGACGAVEFSVPDGSLGAAAKSVHGSQRAAFASMRAQVEAQMKAFVANRAACRDTPTSCSSDPSPAALAALPATYRSSLEASLTTAWQSVNSAASAKMKNVASEKGWLGAGEWAQTLSQFQGSMSAASRTMPRVAPPSLESAGVVVNAAQQWLGNGLMQAGNPIIRAQVAAASGMQGAEDGLLAAIGTGLWKAVAEVDQTNALAGLSTTGYAVWVTGASVLAVSGAVEGVVKSVTGAGGFDDKNPTAVSTAVGTAGKWWAKPLVSGIIGAVGGAIKPIVNGACLALIVSGMGLAYIVPALPFIRFFFAVIGWLIALVEAVMLVPVALALMVSAEQGGFFGPAAKAGLWSVVAVVIRPLLTLAGFVVGLMLISASVGLLNTLMLPMVRDIMQGGLMLLAFVAYVLVYLVLAYVAVNVSTKAAELLPMAAYRWLGANAGGERDDGATVTGAIGGVSSRMMTEIGMRARAGGRDKK